MKNAKIKILGTLLLLLIMVGCEDIFKDTHQEGYEDPPWLGGTIHETLKKQGNYNSFLELITKAGYDEAIEKGLFTLFAADDESFQEYFQKQGISSIADISEDEALRLFELNVLNTPRSREQLIYDWVFYEWQSEDSEVGATIFRWLTRSKSKIYADTVKFYETNSIHPGDVLHIKGQVKYVPLISTEFMRDFNGASDGSDYTIFFPETEWSGLQWYNANVDSAEVRCSNGFIYFLDKVVPEIPSIEEYLNANKDKYGLFYDLAQRYATYAYSGLMDDKETRVYSKSYSGITNFANEVGPFSHGIYCRRATYSAFIPTNEVLQEYLNNTVYKYYNSIDSLPEVTLTYLIQSHITSHFDLASKIEKIWYNYFGDEIEINPDNDFNDAILLSNGAFYGLNRVLEPYAFQTVCGPLFYNNNYSIFLHIMNLSGVLPNLARADVFATVLAPTNEKIEEYGIRYNKTKSRLEKINSNDNWENMTDDDILEFAKNHFVFEERDDFSDEGVIIMNSKLPVYYNNNTLISGGNQEDNDDASITEIIDSKINGKLMYVDNVVKPPKYNLANLIGNTPDLSEFFGLCVQAGLVDTITDANTGEDIANMSFLSASLIWTAFLPNNNAITSAKFNGLIPSNVSQLKEFIQYHFIKDVSLTDFDIISDIYETARLDSQTSEYSSLSVSCSNKNLQVEDATGQQVSVPHSTANLFAQDGNIQIIGSILNFK